MFRLCVTSYFISLLWMTETVDLSKNKNWPSQFDEYCGESYTDRIFGGTYANIGQFPWIAQLMYFVGRLN